jgi:hypothetical protein
MTKPKKVTLTLTESELKELDIAVGPHKRIVRSRHMRLQNRYGYRDQSLSLARLNATRSVIKKLSEAKLKIEEV